MRIKTIAVVFISLLSLTFSISGQSNVGASYAGFQDYTKPTLLNQNGGQLENALIANPIGLDIFDVIHNQGGSAIMTSDGTHYQVIAMAGYQITLAQDTSGNPYVTFPSHAATKYEFDYDGAGTITNAVTKNNIWYPNQPQLMGTTKVWLALHLIYDASWTGPTYCDAYASDCTQSIPKTQPYSVIHTLQYGDVQEGQLKDVSLNWINLFDANFDSSYKTDMTNTKAGLQTKINNANGGWAVFQEIDNSNTLNGALGNNYACISQTTHPTPCQYGVDVVQWTDDANDHPRVGVHGITFDGSYCVTRFIKHYSLNTDIEDYQRGETCYNSTTGGNYWWSTGTYFVNTNNMTYDTGYSSFSPPKQATPATTINKYPNWKVTATNNVGTFVDTNFNTIDGVVPFTCDQQLIPVLHYQIFDKTKNPEQLLVTSYTGASGSISYDFGTATTQRNFEILGWYDCSDGINTITGQGRKNFSLNIAGGLQDTSNPLSDLVQNFNGGTNPFASIVVAPLRLIQGLTNSTYNCTALSIPLPYINRTLGLPCMTPIYSTYFGTFFVLWQTIITGLVGYWVVVRFMQLFKETIDPTDDKIEVLDL